jgi:N utilization substance protein B
MEIYDYDVSLASLIDNFNRGFELTIDTQGFIAQTAQAIIDQRNVLDDNIKPLLANWRFDRIGICTKLILRIAIWEFINTETDSKIIINEAIELAKCFAERDAYKFINGILDEFLKRSGKTPAPPEPQLP